MWYPLLRLVTEMWKCFTWYDILSRRSCDMISDDPIKEVCFHQYNTLIRLRQLHNNLLTLQKLSLNVFKYQNHNKVRLTDKENVAESFLFTLIFLWGISDTRIKTGIVLSLSPGSCHKSLSILPKSVIEWNGLITITIEHTFRISNLNFKKKKKLHRRILLAIERAEYHIINEPKMTNFEYFHILYFEWYIVPPKVNRYKMGLRILIYKNINSKN